MINLPKFNNKLRISGAVLSALVLTLVVSNIAFLDNSPEFNQAKIASIFSSAKKLVMIPFRIFEKNNQNSAANPDNLAQLPPTTIPDYPSEDNQPNTQSAIATLIPTNPYVKPTTAIATLRPTIPYVRPSTPAILTLAPTMAQQPIQLAQGVIGYDQGTIMLFELDETARVEERQKTLSDGRTVTIINFK